MRACVQRVTRAHVSIQEQIVARIEHGLVILLGVGQDDQPEDARYLAEKIVDLRIFADPAGKMNLGMRDIGGEMLVISQFTLYGDCRRGRRPSFSDAAEPTTAIKLYETFVHEAAKLGITVRTGQFREHMAVELVNDGPVTLLLDSRKSF
jgi:D-tyrosyl-tRNA(Tyr) deacylase